MLEQWDHEDYVIKKQNLNPVSVKDFSSIDCVEELLESKPTCVSFSTSHVAKFLKKGAYVVLDYGKELCGGIRMIAPPLFGPTKFRITFGESLSECYSSLGEKNATNDHALRDFEVEIPNISDQTFGQTGFRFVKIELLTESPVWIKNIYAVNTLSVFEKEGYIKTSDEELNRIIDTAIYTLKLNFQNGYIWDGIKRDRLVWSGDLHQEIVNSVYLFGENKNVTNSLSFLKEETPAEAWINDIPSYSAWWVINLCDYCRMTGNTIYFEENKEYAKTIMQHFNHCVSDDGTIDFHLPMEQYMCFFLDWPTYRTDDAVISTAALIMVAAERFLKIEDDENCSALLKKLQVYLDKPCQYKQTRAFQILAGRNVNGESEFLEKGGAVGFSTFMAYYILTADGMAGGTKMLSLIKEYFGGMISRGATTFWEDFNVDWLEGSGRIDELPKEGEKDLHGDYGAYCYKGFRHSLCHGWASGVFAFVVEHMLGLKLINGGETYEITPCMMGVRELEARLPVKNGWLHVKVKDGEIINNEIKL